MRKETDASARKRTRRHRSPGSQPPAAPLAVPIPMPTEGGGGGRGTRALDQLRFRTRLWRGGSARRR